MRWLGMFHGAQKEGMVGTTGFEPATSRTPSVRATRLRHVPLPSVTIVLDGNCQMNLLRAALGFLLEQRKQFAQFRCQLFQSLSLFRRQRHNARRITGAHWRKAFGLRN